VDHRADIYSLGVVFYEMLTGELPIGRFAPPSEISGADPRVDEVVLHALEKERERRTQTAGDVKAQVETISTTPRSDDSRSGRVWRAAKKPPHDPNAGNAPSDRTWKYVSIIAASVLLILAIPAGLLLLSFLAYTKSHTPSRQQEPAAPRPPDPASAHAFGAAIERVINTATAGTNFLISFRTGELRTPPPETARSMSELYRWAKGERMNAAAGMINSNVLSGFDMAVVTAPAQCWDELSPAQAARRLDLESIDSFAIMSHGRPSTLPDTCVFRTRDGGIGILQVTELVTDPPGLRVRYKFQDKLPAATQSASNGVAAEWSPVLLPGEKPDLRKILDEAKKLTSTGHFEEALQRYVWHHNHAQESGDSYQNIVRLTSALSDWEELGRRYPKAKQALIEIRDHKTREIVEGRGYSEMVQEVRAINRELEDDDATYELFKTICQKDPKLARQSYAYVEDLLMSKGDYDLCLAYIGDPRARFESYRRSLEIQQESQQRMNEMNRKIPARAPRMPDGVRLPPPPDMGQMATNYFVGQVCRLIEILVGAGHKAEAEAIRDQAVILLDDARSKSAVSDAGKVTGK
jgi:hypothetical protein